MLPWRRRLALQKALQQLATLKTTENTTFIITVLSSIFLARKALLYYLQETVHSVGSMQEEGANWVKELTWPCFSIQKLSLSTLAYCSSLTRDLWAVERKCMHSIRSSYEVLNWWLVLCVLSSLLVYPNHSVLVKLFSSQAWRGVLSWTWRWLFKQATVCLEVKFKVKNTRRHSRKFSHSLVTFSCSNPIQFYTSGVLTMTFFWRQEKCFTTLVSSDTQ